MQIQNLNFGQALEQLQAGKRVTRQGWNGKGMFLLLVKGEAIRYTINQHYGDGFPDSDGLPVRDAIYMKTANDELVAWVASQSDILADDWLIV